MTDAAAPAPAAGERVAALDGLRGIAILLVLAMHTTFFGHRLPGAAAIATGATPFAHPYMRLSLLGWCGVDVFFVLNGFLITGILLRGKDRPHYFRDFYARRALRIFPLYYLVLVLLLYVLPRAPASPAEQASYLLYYQNIRLALVGERHQDIARLVTWSLAIEEQFYLVWPAIVWFASRRALRVVCVVAIALAFGLRLWLVHAGFERAYFFTPCRLDALAAGALLQVVPALPKRSGRLLAGGGAALLVAIAFWAYSPLPEDPRIQVWGMAASVVMAIGLVSLARADGFARRLFENRVLRSFGQYSYCIYLTHLLVCEWWVERLAAGALTPATVAWLEGHVPPVFVLLGYAAICVATAWLLGIVSWHVFEKHFLALKRYFAPRADLSG